MLDNNDLKEHNQPKTDNTKYIRLSIFIITIITLVIISCITIAIVIYNYEKNIDDLELKQVPELTLTDDIDEELTSSNGLIIVE